MSEYRHSLIEMQKNTSHYYRPPPRRFTPYWAAEIQGGEEVAKEIAKKYRFVYLGQILPGVYYFRHLRVVKRSAHMNTYYQRQLFLDPHVTVIVVTDAAAIIINNTNNNLITFLVIVPSA
ncbi:unnamed protein product [Schistocephalus solidus]|uniref:S8_pro-domain domain-containing protein n=1 Tax=Schistocephalus solidus TaxID=70667 RepID=A0A183SMJ9_SCHSO|nr:unnamed protein product [Schistocephalus solidus]